MKKGNVLMGVGMIVLSLSLLLENSHLIGETIFSILIGIALGLEALSLIFIVQKGKVAADAGVSVSPQTCHNHLRRAVFMKQLGAFC